jgi:hypothetical protein
MKMVNKKVKQLFIMRMDRLNPKFIIKMEKSNLEKIFLWMIKIIKNLWEKKVFEENEG